MIILFNSVHLLQQITWATEKLTERQFFGLQQHLLQKYPVYCVQGNVLGRAQLNIDTEGHAATVIFKCMAPSFGLVTSQKQKCCINLCL